MSPPNLFVGFVNKATRFDKSVCGPLDLSQSWGQKIECGLNLALSRIEPSCFAFQDHLTCMIVWELVSIRPVFKHGS